MKRWKAFGPSFLFHGVAPTRHHKLKLTILDPRIPNRPGLVWEARIVLLFAGTANDRYYVSLALPLVKKAIYWQRERISERCTRRARRKHSHRPAKALQKQKVFKKKVQSPRQPLPPAVFPIHTFIIFYYSSGIPLLRCRRYNYDFSSQTRDGFRRKGNRWFYL